MSTILEMAEIVRAETATAEKRAPSCAVSTASSLASAVHANSRIGDLCDLFGTTPWSLSSPSNASGPIEPMPSPRIDRLGFFQENCSNKEM
jgi:hypothetical protein